MTPTHGSSAQNILLEERVESSLFRFRGRHRGLLTLTSEAVIFASESGDVREIPLSSIDRADEGPAHPFPSPGMRTLRITYSENIVFAVQVENPQQWMTAIDTLAPMDVLNNEAELEEETERDPRSFRIVIVLMLLLVILTTVAVPLLLTWMNARENQPVEPLIPQVDSGLGY